SGAQTPTFTDDRKPRRNDTRQGCQIEAPSAVKPRFHAGSKYEASGTNVSEVSTVPKERKTMFSKKDLFVPAALIFAGFFGVSAANAQNPYQQCFTLQSLQGNYSIVTNYGAYVAFALSPRSYDGNGNLSGSFITNEPTAGSTTGARTLVTGTQVGTYTVNCNGTGRFIRTLTQSNGTVTTSVDDFIITGAVVQSGRLLATTIVDVQETPSSIVPGGLFVTRTHNRMPDAPI
ncbi:MAG: hypothetical protein ACLQOO_09655, partial [Terriglobia bacterium]